MKKMWKNRGKSCGFCDEIGWKRMSLGVEEPGVEEGQEAVSKVTIGEWIMDYDEPTFCPTWL